MDSENYYVVQACDTCKHWDRSKTEHIDVRHNGSLIAPEHIFHYCPIIEDFTSDLTMILNFPGCTWELLIPECTTTISSTEIPICEQQDIPSEELEIMFNCGGLKKLKFIEKEKVDIQKALSAGASPFLIGNKEIGAIVDDGIVWMDKYRIQMFKRLLDKGGQYSMGMSIIPKKSINLKG